MSALSTTHVIYKPSLVAPFHSCILLSAERKTERGASCWINLSFMGGWLNQKKHLCTTAFYAWPNCCPTYLPMPSSRVHSRSIHKISLKRGEKTSLSSTWFEPTLNAFVNDFSPAMRDRKLHLLGTSREISESWNDGVCQWKIRAN